MRTIKNLSELKFFFLAAAIIWTLAVTVLCLATFSGLPAIEVDNFDKMGHIVFHVGIVLLWYFYFLSGPVQLHKASLWKSLAFSLVFGIVIELLQGSLTETRTADINDVFANIVGAVIAAVLILLIKMYDNKVSADK